MNTQLSETATETTTEEPSARQSATTILWWLLRVFVTVSVVGASVLCIIVFSMAYGEVQGRDRGYATGHQIGRNEAYIHNGMLYSGQIVLADKAGSRLAIQEIAADDQPFGRMYELPSNCGMTEQPRLKEGVRVIFSVDDDRAQYVLTVVDVGYQTTCR